MKQVALKKIWFTIRWAPENEGSASIRTKNADWPTPLLLRKLTEFGVGRYVDLNREARALQIMDSTGVIF